MSRRLPAALTRLLQPGQVVGLDLPTAGPPPPGSMLKVVLGSTRPGLLDDDRSLPLIGRGRIAEGELAHRLRLDHLPGLVSTLADAFDRGRLCTAEWFAIPPLALVGDPMVSMLAARSVARVAGVPHMVIDVGEGCPGLDRTPVPGTGLFAPSPIALAMLAADCANPLISVLDAGLAGEESIELLVDAIANGGFADAETGAFIDTSAVGWMIHLHKSAWLPPALVDALTECGVDDPRSEPQLSLFQASLAADALEGLGVAAGAGAFDWERLSDRIDRSCGRASSLDMLLAYVRDDLLASMNDPF